MDRHHKRMARKTQRRRAEEPVTLALVGGKIALQFERAFTAVRFTPAVARELAFGLWEAAKDAERFQRTGEDCEGR